MNDIFGKVVSLFLAAIILFGMPLVYMNERVKTAEQLYLLTEVTHFVDSVCNTGYVSGQMLRSFHMDLSTKSSLYQIRISHEQPEYVCGTGSAVFFPQGRFPDGNGRETGEMCAAAGLG